MSCRHSWRWRMGYEAALSEADAALAIAPDALDAMAIHASVELLADKSLRFGSRRFVQ